VLATIVVGASSRAHAIPEKDPDPNAPAHGDPPDGAPIESPPDQPPLEEAPACNPAGTGACPDTPTSAPACNAEMGTGACPDTPRELPTSESAISPGRRAIAIASAVMPGFFLRGTGSWVLGNTPAAKRLFLTGAAGLVVAGAFGALIGISNGHPYTIATTPLLLSGAGVWLTSWVEDIWIAATGNDIGRRRAQRIPLWSLEVGETWQHDAYRERIYQRVGANVDVDRFGASALGMYDFGGDAWLAFLDVRARLVGTQRCGDCLTIRTGGRFQRDRADRVTQFVGEIEAIGRLDLQRFGPSFRSTFFELTTGIGANHVIYAGTVSETDTILLGRFAWGTYVPGGEVTIYYDHRRDGLAGGIDAWRAAGFMGSFGAAANVRVHGPWAVRGEFQIGNAYLSTLALSYRGGLL